MKKERWGKGGAEEEVRWTKKMGGKGERERERKEIGKKYTKRGRR